MRVAFFGLPHIGGTYTLFRHLRDGLCSHGVTVRWLASGREQAEGLRRAFLAEEMRYGSIVAPEETSETRRAEAIVEHLQNAGYDAVIVNVLADRVQTNVARYLHRSLLRLMIVHNITPGTYAAAAAVRDHVHATVAVSPRILDDLARRHRFPVDRLHAIPNALNGCRGSVSRKPRRDGRLRILSLGRVEETAKGVFWLPRILGLLQDLPVSLTIAGTGPDQDELRRRLQRFGVRVSFLGDVPPVGVSEVMAGHDVLLMPSRFEGFGFTLLEAMATGCVPIASHLRGVTDFVVSHGRTGLLFPVGDIRGAAAQVRRLAEDRDLLERLSAAGAAAVAARFRPSDMLDAYAGLLLNLKRSPPPISPPYSMHQWRMPAGLRPGLRTYLPQPMKNFARSLLERAAKPTPSGPDAPVLRDHA